MALITMPIWISKQTLTIRRVPWLAFGCGLAMLTGLPAEAVPGTNTPPVSRPNFGAGDNAATERDHQHMLDVLHITSLRRGRDGNNPQSPYAANYDETKANPYPKLPDPLLLANGQKVVSPEMWWQQRRPEIAKDLGTTQFPPMGTALIDVDLAFRQHNARHTDAPKWPVFLQFASRFLPVSGNAGETH